MSKILIDRYLSGIIEELMIDENFPILLIYKNKCYTEVHTKIRVHLWNL